jgi:hypothetical protein
MLLPEVWVKLGASTPAHRRDQGVQAERLRAGNRLHDAARRKLGGRASKRAEGLAPKRYRLRAPAVASYAATSPKKSISNRKTGSAPFACFGAHFLPAFDFT